MPKRESAKSTQIDSVKHQDKRANIPTEELRDFMQEEDRTPKTIVYPRDPSLDPQLVWKGKDEQDSKDLEVPAVPIYIQEKIHPHAIIEGFRSQVRKESKEQQLNLFGDFSALNFDQEVDFYRHEVNWANRMILGDSLLVMNSLGEKEGLKGKVQCIYFDPPYGIKFGSNWQVSTRKREVKDGKAEEATRQPEQVKAFRDTWELGIHSYLAYLRDRLVVARELLAESGSIFVQIGDENVHLVRCLMDEIFGSENFVNQIVFTKTTGFSGIYLSSVYDQILWYSKKASQLKYRQLYKEKETASDNVFSIYRPASKISNLKNKNFGAERLVRLDQLTSQGAPVSSFDKQIFHYEGKEWLPASGLHWKTTTTGLIKLAYANRIAITGKTLGYIRCLDDFPVYPVDNIWRDTGTGSFTDPKIYVVQTGIKVIQRCILMATDPGDLVLDPTMGSATTAYVAEQLGRRWITIDTSRVALALARTRLMAAKFDYYYLADSEEGIIKEAELKGQASPVNPQTNGDIRKGFVYKRVPHITLKSIANNQEIDTIHAKWQEKLEPIRTELNRLLKQKWEEWEIPREEGQKWPQEAKDLHQNWWRTRLDRQKEIDESIARNADYETLYDQPYEDKKRVRVTGPFTVESLSPHRVLSTDERPASEGEGTKQASDRFEVRIIENLKKAGVQNTKKGERLKFDSLEPYAGTWLQATGEYSEADGTVKRVAVSIGPEYGTVGTEQIKEAAKEAVRGLGHDLLIVCGFAFDPNVTEESKNLGKLRVLVTKINPDLLLGDELLKKTGAANLFMVFGEPDIAIDRLPDGKITVELKGLDIYDPTTGEIRSSSTDDIACWFIDTEYNEESFFVRHAYFTGADRPYEKLKRTLKAEVDEDAWEQLYSTVSRPFDPPIGKGKTGKIAVKVINHYGDEVLKVYEVK
ncbi:site-specific DNA-methyltransferase [Pannus brasiliensis CCIBt3594]|uniref:Site-specific DNA-methyltransferase n=1 Tax=Pannus brasiliensis CCIBt3594 TaxID=1427578 RepID=A0AAW9QQI9_9CHRO